MVAGLTNHAGLIYGGGWYILGVQTLACVAIIAWAVLTSFLTFKVIDLTIGLRISTVAEIIGADVCEHSINGTYDTAEGVIRTQDGRTFQVPSGPVLSKRDVLKIMDISLALRNKVPRSAYGKSVGLHGRRPSTANISDDGKTLVIRRARWAADDVTRETRELPEIEVTSHHPEGRHGHGNDAFDEDAEGNRLKVPAEVH
ncbi:uncharacterized protein [Branchiostoma lanceolatum]|uniref:uncharacterized protein n=1 Tax=Branchiostoma lanceolatum TaxID=7740 RepID=UPI0034561A8C